MKRTITLALTAVCMCSAVTISHATDSKKPVMAHDTKPGPAYQTVDGTLNKIDGNIYVMEDYTGKEMRLYVSKNTKKVRGEKKPGDSIRAEVTKGWHANSIQ